MGIYNDAANGNPEGAVLIVIYACKQATLLKAGPAFSTIKMD
jgi:hypothetical protein